MTIFGFQASSEKPGKKSKKKCKKLDLGGLAGPIWSWAGSQLGLGPGSDQARIGSLESQIKGISKGILENLHLG